MLPRGRKTRIAVTGLVVVSGLGLAVELIHLGSHAELVEVFVGLLSLSYETNLPTWYASTLLAVCGLSLFAIADQAASDRGWWRALGAIFLYISFDEAVEIHENLGGWFGGEGLLYFDWVIPASIIVAVLGAVFLPFLFRLAPLERRRFVLAGAIYVGGALVLELPLGLVASTWGDDHPAYAGIDWLEETMELAGATLFLLSLEDLRARARGEAQST
jgi:hypothetical protein